MVTWPIFLALIFAYFAVRYTIRMEEEAEFSNDNNLVEKKELGDDHNHADLSGKDSAE